MNQDKFLEELAEFLATLSLLRTCILVGIQRVDFPFIILKKYATKCYNQYW